MQTLIEKLEAELSYDTTDNPITEGMRRAFNDGLKTAIQVIRNHTSAPAEAQMAGGVDEEGVKTALKEYFANSYQYPEIRARAAWRAIRPYLQPKPSEDL